ncbi:uncharacterized protein LOC111372837 [Olea europaea var. sylvestris]|uniref:uncharacterized protein LOC111372837 n=1 Tax=Olea europaea var. sylvestris TaxID=158386 RepID=UPI000C1CD837|nr:uncharacterized protein LOC111372837 [Olea europaea var. sylvestris]
MSVFIRRVSGYGQKEQISRFINANITSQFETRYTSGQAKAGPLLNILYPFEHLEVQHSDGDQGFKETEVASQIAVSSDIRDRSKYCDFHRDHGHTTEDCLALKRKIEALIKRGFLGSYVSNDKRPRNNQNGDKGSEGRGNKQPTTGTINIIFEGMTSGGDSSNGRKQYARQPPIISRSDLGCTEDITFGTEDLEGITFPHDDALVISAIIANFEV